MSSSTHKLCVSLMPEEAAQLEEWLPQCSSCDMIEIRLDHLPELDIAPVAKKSRKPLIITLRSRNEGGFWRGSPEAHSAIMQKAADAGAAYIDIELGLADAALEQLTLGDTRLVLSHHTSERDPGKLREKLEALVRYPAAVYKLIIQAETLTDNLAVLALIEQARALDVSFVIHAMGAEGRPSRLIGAVRGNAWTYVAKDYEAETASGQPALHEACNFYYLQEKTSKAKILGLIGNPIQQSRGWRLHNQLFHEKLAASADSPSPGYLYMNFPTEDVASFWQGWQHHLDGFSVTIPYKEEVVRYLSEASVEVRISGVCNTVVKHGDKWRGYNTDLLAIEELLRGYHDPLKNGGLVIGTGATARSTIAALKRLEVNPIFVVGRNVERGQMLMNKYGIDFLEPDEIHYASAAVIVQTTPVGMAPYTDQYPVGTSLFRKNRVVMDVVYNPIETRFLKIASDRGCIAVSGMQMFLLQAAQQFELFTGTAVSVEEVSAVWENIH